MTQVGQYIISNNSTSNLILHITKKLVSGESLFNLKQEEILIIQNVCTLMFSHGIQILLLRETLHNIGVSDLVVLNRKVPDEFWFKIFCMIKQRSGSEILKHIFNIMFSIGAIYNHRLLKLCRYFNKFWGQEVYEPFIRKICKHLWFGYLIFFDKIKISHGAFSQQKPEHRNGLFTFIQNDFKVFCGIVEKEAKVTECNLSDLFSIGPLQF